MGCTAADVVLENCAATGSVTALAGSAGGLAGRNEGTIRGGTPGGGAPLTVCAQSGCAGGFAACNTGTVENAALSLDTLRLTGAAGVAGGVAGCNAGAVRGVTVTAQDPWDLTGLTAASLTAVGGAVGENAGNIGGNSRLAVCFGRRGAWPHPQPGRAGRGQYRHSLRHG